MKIFKRFFNPSKYKEEVLTQVFNRIKNDIRKEINLYSVVDTKTKSDEKTPLDTLILELDKFGELYIESTTPILNDDISKNRVIRDVFDKLGKCSRLTNIVRRSIHACGYKIRNILKYCVNELSSLNNIFAIRIVRNSINGYNPNTVPYNWEVIPVVLKFITEIISNLDIKKPEDTSVTQ